MSSGVSKEFCLALPKAELHAHLNGSVPISTLLELCKEQGKDISASSFFLGERGDRSMVECFKLFDLVYQLTQEDSTIYRITKDVICSFAEDNVTYLELRTTPKDNPATGRTKESYLQAVLKAIKECNDNETLHITTKIILSIDRRKSIDDAEDTVNLAISYKSKGVVGLDWCGNPEIGYFHTFRPSFQRGREAGLKCTIHFAEVAEPENVREIMDFKPERIGHATILSSEDVIALKEKSIPMEICFTSNLLCKTVEKEDLHHFHEFYSSAYPLVICTDDKGVFGSSLSDEYYKIATTFNLSETQVEQLAKNSFKFSF